MRTKTGAGALHRAVARQIRIALAGNDERAADLARKLGQNDQWMSRKLRGLNPITLDELERIAEALECRPEELIPRIITNQYSSVADHPSPMTQPHAHTHSFGPADSRPPGHHAPSRPAASRPVTLLRSAAQR